MDELLYPRDLLDTIKAEAEALRLDALLRPRVWPPNITLPDDATLTRLLNVCYQAGLLREESRLLSFCVAYHFSDANAGNAIVRFGSPVPFNPQQIRRLAPATDPRLTTIAVRPTASGQGHMEIFGLYPPTHEWYGDMFLQGVSKSPKPDALIIRCLEPGALQVGWADYQIVELKEGTIHPQTEDCFRTGPFAEFVCRGAKDLFAAVHGDATAMNGQEREQAATEVWLEYTGCLRGILSRTREQTHGALILMMPEAKSSPDLRTFLRPKYECDFHRVWNDLVEGIREKTSSWKTFRSTNNEAELQRARERFDTIQERQGRSFAFLAQLAAIDGALVITDHFRLLGFGVEVRCESSMALIEIARVPKLPDGNLTSGGTESIEKYGTRHRSAFRFCEAAPDCAAFILSQDGGVKAVRNIHGTVHMWQHVSLG
jgi:hypothetical protein